MKEDIKEAWKTLNEDSVEAVSVLDKYKRTIKKDGVYKSSELSLIDSGEIRFWSGGDWIRMTEKQATSLYKWLGEVLECKNEKR